MADIVHSTTSCCECLNFFTREKDLHEKERVSSLIVSHRTTTESATLVSSLKIQDGVVENYIPFRFNDLRDLLIKDHPDVFQDPLTLQKFHELCGQLSMHNKVRLAREYRSWQAQYALKDPDVDVELLNHIPHTTPLKQSLSSLATSTDFESTFVELLQKAGFKEMGEKEVEDAFKSTSENGLEVTPPDPRVVSYKIYTRGIRYKEVQSRTWKRCFQLKRKVVQVYQRLCVVFTLQAKAASLQPSMWQRITAPFRRSRVKVGATALTPDLIYLKMFKDIQQRDLDLLLPGSEAKFSRLDYLLVWVPILVGITSAIVKLIRGSISFATTASALTSFFLIVLPFTWGFKAYSEVKRKEHELEGHLHTLYLLHNLNNNAGVLSQLLDEAQEQEDNEALLAYFFLWVKGQQHRGITKAHLDSAVEQWLSKCIASLKHLPPRIDFEVKDAIDKLRVMDILKEDFLPDGTAELRVVGVDLATQRVDLRNLKSPEEEQCMRDQIRAARLQPLWYECFAEYPNTGQRFRYFWNPITRDSTYNIPSTSFVPVSDQVFNEKPWNPLRPNSKQQSTVGSFSAVCSTSTAAGSML